jgi:hypothetical protein
MARLSSKVFNNAVRAVLDYCSTDDEFDTLLEHVREGGNKEDCILWQAAILKGTEKEVEDWLAEKLAKK